MSNPNRFFVYEGNTLRAAQSTLNGAMRYMAPGRVIYTDVDGSWYCLNDRGDVVDSRGQRLGIEHERAVLAYAGLERGLLETAND